MEDATFNILEEIHRERCSNPEMGTRLVQTEDGEVVMERFVVIDNLRMEVVPVDIDNPPSVVA